MSDVSKLRRSGRSPFPTIRKSADPFQPEMGEMDFHQEVDEFDAHYSTAVQEPEKAEQGIINDQNPRKQYRRRKRKRKNEDDEVTKTINEDSLIDIQA